MCWLAWCSRPLFVGWRGVLCVGWRCGLCVGWRGGLCVGWRGGLCVGWRGGLYLLQQGSRLSALVDVAPVQRARVVSGLTKRFMELELHDVGDEVSEIKESV